MKTHPIRLVVVDDHEMVLEGLKALLARFHGRVRMVGQAVTAERAESLVASLDPDVVMTDVRLRATHRCYTVYHLCA